MSDLLKIEVEGGVAVLTVNRPDKLNALNAAVIDALDEAFARFETDDAVRCVVVTGAGEKAFVAGADIAELAENSPLQGEACSRRGQAVFQRIAGLGKPVIAAINGFALGGGLELALAATFRTASTTAKVGLPEVTLGIIPGYGGTQRLPRLVGLGRALEMMLTGGMIDAAEAHRIGLVNHVHEPAELLDATRKLAGKLARQAPIATRFILEAAHRGADLPLAEGQALEASLFGLIASTHDTKEGLRAFLEKRKPEFDGS
ncbi:MAG: enoyl-CoA hydratase/isomerase family protein [Planctomycetota bacterium JB042]